MLYLVPHVLSFTLQLQVQYLTQDYFVNLGKNMNLRKSPLVLTLILGLASTLVSAHEVWLERDANGPVRVYLGEPGEPDSGDAIDTLQGSIVFTDSKKQPLAIMQQDNHWLAQTTDATDVRLFTTSVWEPWEIGAPSWWQFWKDDQPNLQGAVLEAKVGRQETQAKLNFEFVPTQANGQTFTAYFQGSALSHQSVEVRSPSGDTTEITTDEKGQFMVTTNESGRYLVSSVHSVDVESDAL